MTKSERAVGGSLVLAVGFWLVIATTKEIPAIYLREPWQDDPYDALISFMLSAVPLWTVLVAIRVAVWRPFSDRRAIDVLRAFRVQSRLVEITLLAGWVSVALGDHRAEWNQTTGLLLVVQAALTVFAVVVAGCQRAALAELRTKDVTDQVDWIGDALTLGERIAGDLRPARLLLRVLDRFVAQPLRSRPLRTTGILSLIGGVVMEIPQVVLEGYPVDLALLVMVISAASLFAFLVVAGAHLRVVAPRKRNPGAWVYALVGASLAIPLAATFRSAIWPVVGVNEDSAGIGDFAVLTLGAGAIVGVLVLVIRLVPAAKGPSGRSPA